MFEYVDVHMRNQKGVTIHGFGTFTFATVKLDIGNNKYVLLQRPVFLISEKFAQTHALQYTKYHITGKLRCELIKRNNNCCIHSVKI